LARTKWYAAFHVAAVAVAEARVITAFPPAAYFVDVLADAVLNTALSVSVAVRYAA
jgi:hypothetical protein